VNKARFDEVWCPRVGEDATEQMWRGRWAGLWLVLIFVLAGTSSFLWGTGPLGDALGGLLIMGSFGCLWLIMRARRRTSAAISDWFGIKRLRAIPSMSPERFDQWRTNRGYVTPQEREAAETSATAAGKE
jgi:hypothetical protein